MNDFSMNLHKKSKSEKKSNSNLLENTLTMKTIYLTSMLLLFTSLTMMGQPALEVSHQISKEEMPKASCAQWEGVWEYDLPNQRGMAFIHHDRFLWILVPKERAAFASGDPTPEEKAAAFDGFVAQAGTMECEGIRGTPTFQYSKIPQESGQSFQFDLELNGDKAKYWILQPDGSRGPESHSHRVATFDKPGKKGCDQISGFWEYILPEQEGIFVATGEYFAWVVFSKGFWQSKPDLNAVENKAHGFDSIIAAAGTFSCDNNQFTWNHLHAKDYRAEGTRFSAEIASEKDILQYWILDGEGKRIEPGGKIRRLK